MKKRKVILIVIITVVVGLVGWQISRRILGSGKGFGNQRREMPVAVEITAVKKATIRDHGNFTGTLAPKSQFMIAPKISGRLEKLMVNIGDRITRNQLIAQLDDDEYSQQVIQAEADLRVAQANLEESLSSLNVAKRELERIQELHKRGISADSELDSAKGQFATQDSKYKVSQAQVAHKEAALEAAKVRLSYTKIRATWEDGSYSRVVGERFVDEGAMLQANSPILSILEINPLLAIIHITDKDYFRVKKGQNAIISSSASPGSSVSGKIIRIAPLLKETSRQARIEIEIPNPNEFFKPGMFVNVLIEFGTHTDTTVVPVSSVVTRDNQRGVFLADLENRTAQFVPVKVGITSGELAEIVDPPSFSGFVVTLGQHLLVHGSPIILPKRGNDTPLTEPPPQHEEKDSSNRKQGEKK